MQGGYDFFRRAVTIVARLEISITISMSVPCFNTTVTFRPGSVEHASRSQCDIYSDVNSQIDFLANGSFDPIDVRRNFIVQPRSLEAVFRASYPPATDTRQRPSSTVLLKTQHRTAGEFFFLLKLK